MFNKLRTAAETARTGYDWYQQNPQAIHDMGSAAYRGADMLQQDGMVGALGRSRDAAANFVGNPEVRERAMRIGTEVGGAAVRGALLETGAKKENGKWSIKGVFKSILGLKTGTTYVRAAKGAYQGARTEGIAQWGSTERRSAGCMGATQEAFATAPIPGANPNAFNPFAPSAPGQFAPAAHVPSFQTPPRYEPVYTMPQSNFAPQPGYGRTGPTPFDAGYPVANNPISAPSVNMPRTTFSPPPVLQRVDMHDYF